MKFLFAIIIAICSVSMIMAQTDSLPKNGGGYLQLKASTVDVGTISGDTVVTGVFTAYNTGNEPVTITKIFSGCNCAVPSFSHSPIAPGDSTQFEVKYDPRGYRWGRFRRTLRLRSTATNSHQTIVITGTIARKAKK